MRLQGDADGCGRHPGLLAVWLLFASPKDQAALIVQSSKAAAGATPSRTASPRRSRGQGDVRNPIEGIELKCPVVVESRALRTDSCGAGKYRGGLGLDTKVRNLVEGRWNFERTRRSKCPPWGIAGGTPGEPGGNLLRLPSEKTFQWITGANFRFR